MNRSKIVLLTIAAGLAACSDNATAPQQTVVQESAAETQGSMQSLTGTDTVRFSITINPATQTYYNLGAGNSLTFPAGSLCNVNSSYGESEWDKPCTKATSPLTVNVRAWLDKKGHARIDFDKHIRFVPSSNPAQWVVITFADVQASLDPFYNVLYCPALPGESGSSSCKDESKKDLSLLVTRNPLTGKITRRIKHFSGYNVAAGEEGGFSFSIAPSDVRLNSVFDVEEAYPQFNGSDSESFLKVVREAKRSGYILASG